MLDLFNMMPSETSINKILNETFTSRYISVIMSLFNSNSSLVLKNGKGRKERIVGCTLEANTTYTFR